jgi:hypothetical protein
VNKTIILSAGLVILLFITESFISNPKIETYKFIPPIVNNSTNPGVFNTGAPNDGNCTDCHSGSPLPPSGIVDFQFSGANQTYLPNQTYTISLSVSSGQKNGFELTILDVYDNKVGHFVAGVNSIVETATGREYVLHTNSVGITSFDFTWESPTTDKGNLFIYYCFNKSDNDGTTNGDKIYMNQELIISGSVGLTEFENTAITYDKLNHAIDFKNINLKSVKLKMMCYSIDGQLLFTKRITNSKITLPEEIKNKCVIISLYSEQSKLNKLICL